MRRLLKLLILAVTIPLAVAAALVAAVVAIIAAPIVIEALLLRLNPPPEAHPQEG